MSKTRLILAFLVVCLTIGITVAALLSTSFLVSITGNIVGVGVSVNPSSITVGSISQGSVTSTNVVITNTGNLNETLTMATTGLPAYLTLSWNCTGTLITPQTPQTAKFTLTASSSAPLGAFNFNVTVTGTET